MNLITGVTKGNRKKEKDRERERERERGKERNLIHNNYKVEHYCPLLI